MLLARVEREAKDACLRDLADAARGSGRLSCSRPTGRIVEAGREEGLNDALIDRLTLTEERIAEMAAGVREIAELEDPVGELVESWTLENGLGSRKERVPIGVIGIVYEARPNVTIDAAALCLKSGNAAVLRGSSSAETSNAFLAGARPRGARGGRAPRGGDLAARRAAATSSCASWRRRRAWST